MKNKHILLLAALVLSFSIAAIGQNTQLVKRTTYKTDRLDFGFGGTVSVTGAPSGSIRVEGWSNRSVEISAVIEIEAPTEADLDRISKVTGFVTEESNGRTGVTSTGTNDKKFLKTVDKKFPKTLLGLPFRIDYVIKVPRYCDLEIDGGNGDLSIAGVEGNMKINYLESEAKIDLVGGAITATIGNGSVELTIPSRSWRGHFADVQIAKGNLNLTLPTGLNADFDATILRTGKIENGFAGFVPKERKVGFTEKSIAAKSGTGAVPLKFTVGDGTLTIREIGKPS
ncbi:MAG: hypothetical protein ACRD6X_20560 [Pyrinomonadaceae bacterium]